MGLVLTDAPGFVLFNNGEVSDHSFSSTLPLAPC